MIIHDYSSSEWTQGCRCVKELMNYSVSFESTFGPAAGQVTVHMSWLSTQTDVTCSISHHQWCSQGLKVEWTVGTRVLGTENVPMRRGAG